MQIYLKNNPAKKFYPHPVWNNGALGFFEEDQKEKNDNRMSSEMGAEQFPVQKSNEDYYAGNLDQKPPAPVHLCIFARHETNAFSLLVAAAAATVVVQFK